MRIGKVKREKFHLLPPPICKLQHLKSAEHHGLAQRRIRQELGSAEGP